MGMVTSICKFPRFLSSRPPLITSTFGKTCFLCKQKEHKANTCPNKNSTNRGQTDLNNNEGRYKHFNGNCCDNCGKYGHISENSQNKEENKDKRPRGYKPQNEESNSADLARKNWSTLKRTRHVNVRYHFGQDDYTMQSRDASQGKGVLGDYTDQGPFDMHANLGNAAR